MDERTARALVSKEGRELLQTGLVARTWGNFSARIPGGQFVITPSGLDYAQMGPEDLVAVDIESGEAFGSRRPSSEKNIHRFAYGLFPEIEYIIHTHQTAATAIGLTGMESMELTERERAELGGVARAEYALSGSMELAQSIRAAMEADGAKVILMPHHGALILGRSREEAFRRAMVLESVCSRSLKGQPAADDGQSPDGNLLRSPAALAWAALGEPLPPLLDDFAQMFGGALPVLEAPDGDTSAVVPGRGIALGTGETPVKALLAEKNLIAALHCRALDISGALSDENARMQHADYSERYSLRKEG